MNRDMARIEHMIDACEKIILFTNVDFKNYQQSLEKQAAVARYFEILGEAANKVSIDLKAEYPDIPWKIAIAVRNILIHDYIKVDYLELWQTAKSDIPALLLQLKVIYQNF